MPVVTTAENPLTTLLVQRCGDPTPAISGHGQASVRIWPESASGRSPTLVPCLTLRFGPMSSFPCRPRSARFWSRLPATSWQGCTSTATPGPLECVVIGAAPLSRCVRSAISSTGTSPASGPDSTSRSTSRAHHFRSRSGPRWSKSPSGRRPPTPSSPDGSAGRVRPAQWAPPTDRIPSRSWCRATG